MTQSLGPRQKALVDALRSGDFQQAKYQLREGNAFCCLGVACQLSGLGKWEGEEKQRYLDSVSQLPSEVMNYYRFRSVVGAADGNDLWLSDLNDSGWSFHEIAQTIESNPAEFFSEEI